MVGQNPSSLVATSENLFLFKVKEKEENSLVGYFLKGDPAMGSPFSFSEIPLDAKSGSWCRHTCFFDSRGECEK